MPEMMKEAGAPAPEAKVPSMTLGAYLAEAGKALRTGIPKAWVDAIVLDAKPDRQGMRVELIEPVSAAPAPRHNVGDTKQDGKAVFHGDPLVALHSVKAKALLMSGILDLYNPVENGIEAAAAIPDGRHVTIPSVQGHVAAAAGFKPADVEFVNETVRRFMADVTKGWTTTR